MPVSKRIARVFSLLSVVLCLGVFSSLSAEDLYYLKDVDTPPKPINQDNPPIPDYLNKYRGTVRIRIVISEEGKVITPSIHESTVAEMDEFALFCVSQWRFMPAIKDGKAVPVAVVVPIRFK